MSFLAPIEISKCPLLPGITVISDGPNSPSGYVRQAEYDGTLPGLGDIGAFTQAGGHPGKNDDAFGISGEGLLMVADGVSQTTQGDKASVMAIRTVIERVREGYSLGEAFLSADLEIRRSLSDGQTVASAVRVYPGGAADVVVAGDVEVWVLGRLADGDYDAAPYITSIKEESPKAYLGGGSVSPRLVDRFTGQPREILVARLSPNEWSGLLLMGDGLANYYHAYPDQLREVLSGHRAASGMRTGLQNDGVERLKVLSWARQFHGRSLHAVPGFVQGSLKGKFVNGRGQVFASQAGGEQIGWNSVEDNQTALVFLKPRN